MSASLNFEFALPLRILALHFRVCVGEKRNLRAQRIEIEQARLETVVQIGCVVGDLVDQSISCASSGGRSIEQIFRQFRGSSWPRNNRANA